MGIIRQGILGGFRKKTGSVVGAYWRKLDVIRGLPRKSSKPPTIAQLNQQLKFALVTSFLSWISNLVDKGFKGKASSSASAMNLAVAYNLKYAVTGISPNFTINYPELMFNRGRLELPEDPDVTAAVGAALVFNWPTGGPDERFLDATDRISILVYDPTIDKFVKVANAAARSAGTYTLNVPPTFVGHGVHCYISFSSVKTKALVSDSAYIGLITVIA
jgi:hypothetical protein